MLTDLHEIAARASSAAEENEFFRDFLRGQEPEKVDQVIHHLNEVVSAQIDCTACGNCCRAFMINVTNKEVEVVAGQLNITENDFKNKYLEESAGGQLIVKTIPCHFLEDNKCKIYQYRFSECREFPHLHRPNVAGRLFGLLMYYGTCPIIYNVIEEAKLELGFGASELTL